MGASPSSGTFWWPQPPVLSQKYCRTNGRRTAVQMGGVLQYKWEVYCWVSLSSRLRRLSGSWSSSRGSLVVLDLPLVVLSQASKPPYVGQIATGQSLREFTAFGRNKNMIRSVLRTLLLSLKENTSRSSFPPPPPPPGQFMNLGGGNSLIPLLDMDVSNIISNVMYRCEVRKPFQGALSLIWNTFTLFLGRQCPCPCEDLNQMSS